VLVDDRGRVKVESGIGSHLAGLWRLYVERSERIDEHIWLSASCAHEDHCVWVPAKALRKVPEANKAHVNARVQGRYMLLVLNPCPQLNVLVTMNLYLQLLYWDTGLSRTTTVLFSTRFLCPVTGLFHISPYLKQLDPKPRDCLSATS